VHCPANLTGLDDTEIITFLPVPGFEQRPLDIPASSQFYTECTVFAPTKITADAHNGVSFNSTIPGISVNS
jgi:hypothetical protein